MSNISTTPFSSGRLRDGHFSATRYIAPVILLVLVALGSGCNTELQESWLSPDFNRQKFNSFAVLGVSRETTLRRVAEDAFVKQLELRGVQGVPSYKILPTDPEPLTREQVEKAVKQQAVQGVIVARVAKVEKEARGAGAGPSAGGGGSGSAGYSSGSAGFAARYHEDWARSYVRGGSEYEYEVVTVDVQLYDVKSGDLVWSGVTRTFDTSDLESSTTYWAKVIIEELAKRGII